MKRRRLGAFLLVFAAWPLVQHALVLRYGVDPWKLMGFAMYCVPGPMKTVRLLGVEPDGSQRPLDFTRYTPEEQRAVDRYRHLAAALGKLQSSDALAREIFELHPEFEGLAVVVFALELDRRTARLRPSLEIESHWRDGREQPIGIEAPFAAPTGPVPSPGSR